MILNNQYFWIKVPRTATIAYKQLFKSFDVLDTYENGNFHTHIPYIELVNKYNKNLPAVTVVRNPLERFISSLKYIIYRKELCTYEQCSNNLCSIHNLNLHFLESTESCVNFLNSSFGRNCSIKKAPEEYSVVFNVWDSSFIRSFFRTQMYFAYHPKVKWFHYENLENFNTWIEETLNIDTNKLSKENSAHQIQLNIDTEDEQFIRVVENMFYDDYKIFDYPLRYLK